jgi:uncharacterized protein YodC (DUF2158 family)
MEGVVMTDLAEGMYQCEWLAIVNTVVNFRIR